MEPNGDDPRSPVGPHIGQTGRNFRLEEFLGRGMLQQPEISLLDLSRHGFLLSVVRKPINDKSFWKDCALALDGGQGKVSVAPVRPLQSIRTSRTTGPIPSPRLHG